MRLHFRVDDLSNISGVPFDFTCRALRTSHQQAANDVIYALRVHAMCRTFAIFVHEENMMSQVPFFRTKKVLKSEVFHNQIIH